jgi:PTH1 family peptidyl-tRNA hydrolase
MKLIVGLGNPGPEYERTRHNAGWMAIDRLARRHAPSQTPRGRFSAVTVEAIIGGQKCLLLKPTTFMNRSGRSVAEAMGFYKADIGQDLLVLVDDIALPLGALRIRPGGGDGGHNGLADIHRALGSDAYPRLRIGIGKPEGPFNQVGFVLGRVSEDEKALLEPALNRTADAAECFATQGLATAMNKFNAPPDADGGGGRRSNPKPPPPQNPGGAPPGTPPST